MRIMNPSFLSPCFPWILWRGPKDVREIFLTFDDGPDARSTPRLLDTLDRLDARATFFLTGSNLPGNENLVRRAHDSGHVLGNHGRFHRTMAARPMRSIEGEIRWTQDRLNGLAPVSAFFRPPFGRFDGRFRGLMNRLGMVMAMWSLMTYDYSETDGRRLSGRVQNKIHNGAVIVFHDREDSGPVMLEALADLIPALRKRGFRFATLKERI
ncbi:MAG TPA: polysaccharide deacetylase family protein [bacterium]|nr:polysaccharide deacetylase family protein [bacterium]